MSRPVRGKGRLGTISGCNGILSVLVAEGGEVSSVFHALIIEDEWDVLELLSTHLGRLGCRVSGAQTGRRGVELAVADPPDAVVVDMMLPDIDGREVIRRLRADDRTARCPIVLCSALDLDNLEDLHADAVLAKPFGKADVAHLVRRLAARERNEGQP